MLTIITREVTGLLAPRTGIAPFEPAAAVGLAVHHSANGADATTALQDAGAYIRLVQQYYFDRGDFTDIAYNWIVLADGRVLEGRGMRYRCAANGTNDGNLRYPSVMFPGDFRSSTSLTSAQIGAFRQLRALVRGTAPKASDVKPHSFFKATECPGKNISNFIPQLMQAPPEPGNPPSRPVIRKGSKGSAVRCFQQLINAWGGATLRVDGDFGNASDIAARRFQTQHGLVVDGVVGAQTWGALSKYGSCQG